MSRKNTQILRAALSALHYVRADALLAPLTSGAGVIFTLHHVRPGPPQPFEPNRILSITPEFLERVIRQVLEAGFDVVGLDDVPGRLASHSSDRPFACFTFDDGYRDNRVHALPIFQKHNLPFTVYVPSEFPSGGANLWWLTLEEVVRKAERIQIEFGAGLRSFETVTLAQKEAAHHEIYWSLRAMPERDARDLVATLAQSHGIDAQALAQRLIMTWEEIRALAAEPLVTIGAHTRGHWALANLSESEARAEIVESIRRLEDELQQPCRHFSYPYGDERSAGEREFRLAREAGVATAVTTRKGLIHAHHKDRLTALPRLSLNGDYQDERFVKVLLSGVPFALRDAVKRVLGARQAA